MCTTPVCTRCSDFDLCFGEESGESRLAAQRRNAALDAVPALQPDIVRLPLPEGSCS
jgi:nitrogen fixation protein NifQ